MAVMENKSDALLGKILKHWASRTRIPAGGRERLLFKAAVTSWNTDEVNILPYHTQYRPFSINYSNESTHTIFNWINESSFQFEFLRLRKYAF